MSFVPFMLFLFRLLESRPYTGVVKRDEQTPPPVELQAGLAAGGHQEEPRPLAARDRVQHLLDRTRHRRRVGTQRGENGKTRVTLVWEPLPPSPGTRREQPGRVSLLAANAAGDLVFRGSSPDAALAAAGLPGHRGPGQGRRRHHLLGRLRRRIPAHDAAMARSAAQYIVEVPSAFDVVVVTNIQSLVPARTN